MHKLGEIEEETERFRVTFTANVRFELRICSIRKRAAKDNSKQMF